MSGFKAITVNTSPETEPHIFAEDDAAIFQTIFGKDGVSTIGQQCEATVISNNKVRVADGVICVGGHFGRIPYGEYVDCEIQNGKTGVNRNDIIVAKFETTGTGGIDTFTCEVIQGTAGSTAADPEITENDLYSGGTVREFPLYRVKLEGLSIVSVDKLFNIIPTNAELLEKVIQLNSDLVTANNALSGKQDKSKYSDECRVISVATANETGIHIKHPSDVSLTLLIITSGGVVASVNKSNGSSKSTVTEIIGNFIAHTGDQNNTYLKTGTYIRSLILFTSSNPSSITIGTYTSS